MPSRPPARSTSRRSTPSSPPKPRQSTQSLRQTRQAAREQNQQVTEPARSRPKDKTLAAVEEEDADVQQDDDASDLINVAEDDVTSPDDNSSFTDSDALASLDRDIIIDNLSAVNQDAESIINMLKWSEDLKELRKSLRDPSSTNSRRLSNFNRRLRGNLDAFGDRLLLRVDLLIQRLRDVPENPNEGPLTYGRWRPDPILHKVNLALLLLHLFPIGDSRSKDEETRAILQYLADTDPFPAPLADPQHDQSVGKTSLLFFNIWTDILTQWFIMCVAADSKSKASFDPDQMLRDIFWDHEDKLRLHIPGDEKSQNRMRSLLQERVNSIRKHFSTTPKKPINMKGLRVEFPWDEFLESVTTWASNHLSTLNARISGAGGVNEIQDALVSGNFSPQEEIAPEEQAPKNKRVSFGKRIEAMRKRNADRDAKQTTVPTSTRSSSVGRERGVLTDRTISKTTDQALQEVDNVDVVAEEVDVEEENPTPTQATAYVLELVASQAKESNKENIPKDKTPQKRRLLDQREEGGRNVHTGNGAGRVSPLKRGRQDVESDSDDGFETDKRSPKRARTSAGKEKADVDHGRQVSPDNNEGTFAGQAEEGEDGDEDEDDESLPEPSQLMSRPPQLQRRRKLPFHEHLGGQPGPSTQPVSSPARPHSDQPEQRPPRSTAPARLPTRSVSATPSASAVSTDYTEVKILAKNNMAYARATHPMSRTTALSATNAQILPIPQARRAWTAEEVEALIESVGLYGTKWAMMLEEDAQSAHPRLQARTQMQLKDKARNIKLDFLKARRALPTNFIGVTISETHKQMLAELDIPYVEGNFAQDYRRPTD